MRMTKFHFDSYQHPGCRIVSCLPIQNLIVTVKQEVLCDTENGIKIESPGRTQTFGHFDLRPNQIQMEDIRPFDVTVNAYDPINNINYAFKILKVLMTSVDNGGAFIAATLLPWYPLDEVRCGKTED